MKTIVTEIEELEQDIQRCEKRLDAIERLGRLKEMTDEELEKLQHEKKSLEKQVTNNRSKLKGLRWENWRSMIVSVILLGLIYVVYCLIYTSAPGQALAS